MDIDSVRLWKMPQLQNYLQLRGLKKTGRKDELVALVFAANEMGLKPLPSSDETKKKLTEEYSSLLKINGEQLPDPLELDGWQREVNGRQKWPPTTYPDMAEFLFDCQATDKRRRELLSDYKEEKAYNYFASGWLQEVFFHPISESSPICYLKAQVIPSQNISNVPHITWVAIQKLSGKIVTAYCTCFAGLGSSCNHVATVLFKVDWVSSQTDRSCTSGPCQWNAPRPKQALAPCKIADMTISNQKRGKGSGNINSVAKRLFSTKRSIKDTALTLDQLAGALYDVCPDAAAFQYAMPHINPAFEVEANVNVAEEVEVETSCCVPLPLPELARHFTTTGELLDNLPLYSNQEVAALEEATRDQDSSGTWMRQRHGRVGASSAHKIISKMRTIEASEGASELRVDAAVNEVLGKGAILEHLPAIKHGRDQEPAARKAYQEQHTTSCKQVSVTKSGLWVHRELCFISASPDGLVNCPACGDGLLEIKCPFSSFGKKPGVHLAFLKKEDGKLALKHSHSYYTQVQQQLAVTNKPYCDFFVCCGDGLTFTQRILPQPTFIKGEFSADTRFFHIVCLS